MDPSAVSGAISFLMLAAFAIAAVHGDWNRGLVSLFPLSFVCGSRRRWG